MSTSQRSYVPFDPRSGYPTGDNLYYECTICGDTLPSLPEDGIGCSCRNIFIDVDAGRMSVRDDSKIKLFYASDAKPDESRIQ
jgi:hypothetical protein